MRRTLVAIAVLVLCVLTAASWVGTRSDLSAQREAIEAEWPNVSAALGRRADLVANLAQTVMGVAGPAKPIFDDIAAARADLSSGSTAQQQIQANTRLMRSWARLLLLTEQYPKLTSSRDYRRLGEEIKEAENAVAIERRKYNEMLEHYNAQLRRFPDNIVAGISGFSRSDAYVTTDQDVR